MAALSGLTDVDAVTISLARMSQDELALGGATGAIITAAAINTAIKGGIAMALGGRAIGLRVLGVYLIVLITGALTVWVA